METVKKSRGGIDYLASILAETKQRVTRAVFWRIPHKSGEEEVNLKIGRYLKRSFDRETLVCEDPKSELTLKDNELRALLEFVSMNYEPFRSGIRKFIPLDESFSDENVGHLKAVFQNPNRTELLEFLLANDILPSDVMEGLEVSRRREAVARFEEMLERDLVESEWQNWFKENDWCLGSDFVRILDSRAIDVSNVADYLVQAYDGFLDIIEIKRPGSTLKFWAASLDHANYVPSSELIKAVTQSTTYIFEVEREVNSQKFLERVGGVQAVKPRCTLVFGRSNDWNASQMRSFRILNSSFHNLTIMTYDHVLERAKRLVGLNDMVPPSLKDDEIPF